MGSSFVGCDAKGLERPACRGRADAGRWQVRRCHLDVDAWRTVTLICKPWKTCECISQVKHPKKEADPNSAGGAPRSYTHPRMNTSTLPWPAPPAPPWAPPDPDAEDWALGLGMMIPMGVCLVLCCFCCMFIFKAIASGAPPEAFMMMATPFICFMVVVLSLAAAAVVLGAQGRGPEAMLIFGSVTLPLPLLLFLLHLCVIACAFFGHRLSPVPLLKTIFARVRTITVRSAS